MNLKKGIQLVTKLKKNMRNRLMPLMDNIPIIETVNDQLKNISQIEHSRHRSITNFMVNLVAGLIAYTYQDKKPSLIYLCSTLGNAACGLIILCRTQVKLQESYV